MCDCPFGVPKNAVTGDVVKTVKELSCEDHEVRQMVWIDPEDRSS